MQTITVKYEVYDFDELDEDAKNKAISEHIQFLIEVYNGDEKDMIHPCVLEAERLQTPWFLGQIIYEQCKDRIIEDIKVNEYRFNKDGTLFTED